MKELEMTESAQQVSALSATKTASIEEEQTAVLINGQTVFAKVLRPFLQSGKVMGVVLKIAGTHETALLHRKKVLGDHRDVRLASLTRGCEVTVKLEIFGTPRNIWASEIDVDVNLIANYLLSAPPKRVEGKVVNQAKYGVFVELQEGPAAGRKGLLHARNMKRCHKPLLPQQFKPGERVWVDVLGAKVDDEQTLRIDLNISDST